MAEFDDVLVNEVLDKLTGQQCYLQVVSIVGMVGIGKTLFARNIYTNPLIVQHFDILFELRFLKCIVCQKFFHNFFLGKTEGVSMN